MNKGIDTRQAILEAGFEMASRIGLEHISIGELAKVLNMSKSGLFAHFQSKEKLQIEILEYAGEKFSQNVIIPALMSKAGIPRIRSLVKHWVENSERMTGGCIFVNASIEYHDRPGRVRDFILNQQKQWIDVLCRIAKSAVEAGDFKPDIDCYQFAYDLFSLLLGFHYYERLLQDRQTAERQENALKRLLTTYQEG